MKGRRPAITKHWDNLRLIKYNFNEKTKHLEFVEVGVNSQNDNISNT